MIEPHRSRRAPRMKAALPGAAAGLLAALLLRRFPPDRYPFYPRCPIYTYLHLQCPGCGATRALAALLRGHIAAALHFNPLTTLLLPVALLYTAHHSWREPPASPRPSPCAIYILLAIAAIFTITRNLPA